MINHKTIVIFFVYSFYIKLYNYFNYTGYQTILEDLFLFYSDLKLISLLS